MKYTGFAALGLIFGYAFALPQAASSSPSPSSGLPTSTVPVSSGFGSWLPPSSVTVHRRQFSTGFPGFTQPPSWISSTPSSASGFDKRQLPEPSGSTPSSSAPTPTSFPGFPVLPRV